MYNARGGSKFEYFLYICINHAYVYKNKYMKRKLSLNQESQKKQTIVISKVATEA